MEASGGPRELLGWMIPFTQIEIRIWDWRRQQEICVFCATEKAKRSEEDAYNAGFDDGVRRVEEDSDPF